MKQPVRVYTPYMDLLHETDNYISLQFMPKFYEVGKFEFHINQYMEGSEHFQKGNIIMLNKREDKVMVIRHREIALDPKGKASENWKITGTTLEGILNQRITIPPEGKSHDIIAGDAETVMKHYVEKHFVKPDDPDRKIDHIEIAPNLHRGKHIKWESRFKNVDEEIVAISKQANLGFVMHADMERKKWIFDVVEARDVTQDNPTGLPPVFFSPDFQTIKSQQFVDSNLNYKNYGYVGGQGEGTEREVVSIGNSKGLDRIETFIDARDVGSSPDEELPPDEIRKMLIDRGEQKLSEMSTDFYLEAQILTPTITDKSGRFALKTPFEYEVDFRLGDVVQVFNKKWNITMNAPITEFKEIYEAGGFVLEATFGESQPTLITKIKNKFDDIEGIDKQEFPVKVAVEQMKQAIQYSNQKLSEEEKARIEQAKANLEEAKQHTEQYAEKIIPEQPTPPNPEEHPKWVDTSQETPQMKLWDGEKWTAVAGEQGPPGEIGPPGPQGLPGPNIVNKDTTFGEKWLLASYIESLNGLNVNDQFIVDAQGNVRFAGELEGASGRFGEVTVVDGDLNLEDGKTGMKFIATPGRNLLLDHSFELVKTDPNSFNQDTINHNWLEMRATSFPREDIWLKSGSPKVAIQWNPDNANALAIFGDQAIVIRNANFVSQEVFEGIGGGGTYTISGHFKRQKGVTPGGTPRFEIDHKRGSTLVGRLLNVVFDPVPDDYSVVRYSATFTVPRTFIDMDSLTIKISGGNNNWVQCDGVQLVEGEKATLYMPEDSIWQMYKGVYPVLTPTNHLWAGASYMNGGQTIYPLKKITDCRTGWLLAWSDYDPGVGENDTNWVYSHIPKIHAEVQNGQGIYVPTPHTGLQAVNSKYLYVSEDKIVGYADNQTSPLNDVVLRAVYEY